MSDRALERTEEIRDRPVETVSPFTGIGVIVLFALWAGGILTERTYTFFEQQSPFMSGFG